MQLGATCVSSKVCLIGTSHFVAMGVMSDMSADAADASLQDPQCDAETDGEEVLWQDAPVAGRGA